MFFVVIGETAALVVAVVIYCDIQSIARQPPMTTIEDCWKRCFLLGPPQGYITRTPAKLQSVIKSSVE
jgi:hypothetical protein